MFDSSCFESHRCLKNLDLFSQSDRKQDQSPGPKIILTGEATTRSVDWASFLSDNTQILFSRPLRQMWSLGSQAIKFVGRSVVLICDGKTLKLTSLDGVHTVREELAEIDSTQDKSDSRVVLYGLYTKNQGNRKKKKIMSAPLELQVGTGIHTSNFPKKEQ